MDALFRKVTDIPMQYRPIPFWSWNDDLEPEELIRQIHWMHDMGIGGFFMHARGGLKTPYLSEKWMQAIKVCCDEAEKLGMFAWAYDENGWPSGFAGGKVLETEEFRDMYITKTVGSLDPNADVSYAITENTLVRTDRETENGDYLNLYLHRSPSTADILNPDAMQEFINVTHQQYKNYLGDEFSAKVAGFFTDEPQYYRGATPYSPTLVEYFREVYGTELFDQLGLLFVEKEGYRTFRYRYRLAMQKLMLRAFAQQIYSWCERNGTRLTGHYVDEISLGGQICCCGGVMPFYEFEHIPGMDWLGAQTDNELGCRQLGSVARQLGKKQVLTETFACCGWNISPAELIRVAGFQYACGVNLLCHHLLPYSEHGQRKKDYPSHFNPLNPWIEEHFRDFNDYFSRLGYLLAESDEPVNVAMLHPIRSAYLEYMRGDDPYALPESELDPSIRAACRKLSARGIGYHFLDETLLEKHGFVVGDKIGCGKCHYTYLVLPKMLTMGVQTEALLRQFVANGGKILLLDQKPAYLEGERFDYHYLESSCTFEEILSAQHFTMEDPDTELYCTYRNFQGQDFLFLQNASAEKAFTQTFRFPENIRSFTALDLITGQTKLLPLTVTLEKNEALLLLPSEKAPPAEKPKEIISVRFENAPVSFDTNFLTVDRVRYSKDGVTYSQPILCCDLFNCLLEERYLGQLWLRYEFEMETIPSRLSILAEKGDFRDHRVNGHPITFDRTLEIETCVAIADIAPYVQPGSNVYEVSLTWHQSEDTFYALFGEGVTETLKNCIAYDSEIEPVYLAGKFGVYSHKEFTPFEDKFLIGEEFYIGDAPRCISETVTDGLPFFRGELTLTQTLTLEKTDVRLALPGDFLTAKVTVNGKKAGELVFQSTLDISPYTRVGENRLEVTFTVGNRNLLGPMHCVDPEKWVSPALFAQNDLPGAQDSRLLYKLRKFYHERKIDS